MRNISSDVEIEDSLQKFPFVHLFKIILQKISKFFILTISEGFLKPSKTQRKIPKQANLRLV